MTITLEEAREAYAKKLETEAAKHIATFPGGLQVLNGQYGPYVTDGKKNVRIPKATDPLKLTEKEAKAMIAKAPDKKKKFVRRTAKKK